MTIYIAPYDVQDEIIAPAATWASPEIEIPYYARGISVSFMSDVDGVLTFWKELGGAYEQFDALPITGGDPTHPVKIYNWRFPKLEMVFTPALGAGAVISCNVDVTPNTIE